MRKAEIAVTYPVDWPILGFGIFAPLMRQEGVNAGWGHVEQLLFSVFGKPLHTPETASARFTDDAVHVLGFKTRSQVFVQKFEVILACGPEEVCVAQLDTCADLQSRAGVVDP